jgi:ATP-dependent Clp protease ATP-binding subunit ClpC
MIKKQAALGFDLKRDEATEDRLSYEEMRKKLTDTLKRAFRPEFINRLDSVIVFRSLSKEDINKIVNLELDKVTQRVKEHQIALVATPAALQSLGEQGFDPDMGARPLRRIIQFNVEDQLSDGLLSGNFTDGDTVQVDLNEDGKIVLAKTTVQDNVPETL